MQSHQTNVNNTTRSHHPAVIPLGPDNRFARYSQNNTDQSMMMMDSASRYAHSAPSRPSALSNYVTMPDPSMNTSFSRSKPAPVYIPARHVRQGSQTEQQHPFSSMPSSPSDSGRSYHSSGSHGSGTDSTSTTAPPSPSSFDFYSAPSIGYIDTSLLTRTRAKYSPDFMSIEPNEIFSPSAFRLPNSANSFHYTPPSSHRSLSSDSNSSQSTPFSSRSRYLVNAPNSTRSTDNTSYRRFDNTDDFLSADITPPHLFNSPILCPVTNHPFNASLMELPSSPLRSSSTTLTNSLAAPMIGTDNYSSMSLYEQSHSRSGYSPYLSPQTRMRSLRSTVLASMQDRTISARLGNHLDIHSVVEDLADSNITETQQQNRPRGIKRDRDVDDVADMSEDENEEDDAEDEAVLQDEDSSDQELLVNLQSSNKSSSSRSRLRTRDANTLVRVRTAPVETSNNKAAKCEHCKTLAINPRYGTGRFCGPKCARTFSIKQRYEKMQAAKAALKAATKPPRRRTPQAPKEEANDDFVEQMEEDEQSDQSEDVVSESEDEEDSPLVNSVENTHNADSHLAEEA